LRRRGLLLVLGVLASACAGQGAQRHPQPLPQRDPRAYLEQEAARFVYVTPQDRVMAQARALLESHGYVVRDDPGDQPLLTTTWRETAGDQPSASQLRRYVVAGKDVGDGRLLVRIFRIDYTTVGSADSHPSLGNRSARQTADGGGARGPSVKGEGVSVTKGWYRRDLELEWQLLQRVEPELAEVLESESTQPVMAAAPPRR
jgi:hypothetical protein